METCELEELPDEIKIVDVTSSFQCGSCKKTFATIQNLYRHERLVHKMEPRYRGGALRCPERNCQFKCSQLVNLRNHLHVNHEIHFEEMKLTFPSMSEFTKWREEEERSSKSMFIARTSMKKLRDGSTRMYLTCHRSGSYKSKGLGKRRLKSQGSCKMNRCCPASMTVEEQQDMVHVQYFKTHCGHSNDREDVMHLRLTESERAFIAGKLSQGMSFEHLLDEFHNNKKFSRFHLVTKKDLYNIQRNFNLQPKSVPKEPETLESWLEKSLAQGEQSSVLYCKDRGINDDTMQGCLEMDDFLLVLASPLQREMLKKFGPNGICIDCSDRGTAQDLSLTAVVVVDEFEEPFPVAFCLSNRVDFTTFKFFFDALRDKVGCIEASMLISDDLPALYGAWGQAMGEYKHHLLCPWYTEKCWKNLIFTIPKAKKAKRSTIQHWLETLTNINEIDRFHEELGAFLDEMLHDEDTGTFASHFKNKFAMRPEMWAHCFLGPKYTTIVENLETMHRSLRNAFCHGKNFGYIVRCISALNKLVREKNCSRLAKMVDCKESGESQEDSEGILVEIEEEDCVWKLQSGLGESHQVQRLSKECVVQNCHRRTPCIHVYSCTCIDYLAYSKCCQHIDIISQLQQTCQSPLNLPSQESQEESPAENEKPLERRVQEKVETLLGFLKKGRFGDVTLNQMEQQIDEWINNLKNGITRSGRPIVTNENVQPVSTVNDIDISNKNNDNNNIVLFICPPIMNMKLPISRYKSPLSKSSNQKSVGKGH